MCRVGAFITNKFTVQRYNIINNNKILTRFKDFFVKILKAMSTNSLAKCYAYVIHNFMWKKKRVGRHNP